MVVGFASSVGLFGSSSTARAHSARSTVRCSMPAEVEEYFPAYRRNKAPLISFDSEVGVLLENKRVTAFKELDDEDSGPLLSGIYDEPDSFTKKHPVPPSAQSWPSGDGRKKKISGDKGNFTQPDLKNYGPFPDFFKRSCDS